MIASIFNLRALHTPNLWLLSHQARSGRADRLTYRVVVAQQSAMSGARSLTALEL